MSYEIPFELLDTSVILECLSPRGKDEGDVLPAPCDPCQIDRKAHEQDRQDEQVVLNPSFWVGLASPLLVYTIPDQVYLINLMCILLMGSQMPNK